MMLIYHPAYDANHCLYRMLLILESTKVEKIRWEIFKLLDFYLLFPHLLKSIQPIPSTLRSYKKIINDIPDSYEEFTNTNRILFDLEEIQNTSILNLMAKEFIELDLFQEKFVKRTNKELPSNLLNIIKKDPLRDMNWFNLIVEHLILINFDGKTGLKARSGLLEYRYDSNNS